MDSRELAVHQFELIQDRLKKQSLAGSAATAWLQKYVVPAVTEYWGAATISRVRDVEHRQFGRFG